MGFSSEVSTPETDRKYVPLLSFSVCGLKCASVALEFVFAHKLMSHTQAFLSAKANNCANLRVMDESVTKVTAPGGVDVVDR